MTVHIEDILLWAISRKGIEYVYAAEADGKPDPRKIDCSELVQWACQQAGMRSVPDGAIWQYKWCERAHTLISVEQALKTRGALMFPYPNVHHVVFSLGDGTTMEAKGAAYGVGIFSAKGRFQRAALIPGVDYSPRKPLPPPEPVVAPAHQEDDLMAITYRDPRTKQVFLVDGGKKLHIDRPQLTALQEQGAVKGEPVESLDLARLFDAYPTA